MNPLPAPSGGRVVAYVRTSSAEQGKAYGPDAQRAAIRAWAAREGVDIVAESAEDVAGTVPADERPGMREAIAAAYERGAAAIVVAEHSRLARDEYVAYDALRALKVAGLRVLYADGSNGQDDSSLLLDGIKHSISAHERRRIVARLAAGREAKARAHPGARAQGGKVPYGYRRAATGLEIDAEQAAQVRRIFELAREGRSLRRIGAKLEAETGRTWAAQTISRILAREDYKLAKPGRIIDPRLWNAAQR